MNSAVIVGRVGQDPEIKYFESGKSKTTFSIAVNRWSAKEKTKVTDWFNVQMWDQKGVSFATYVKKGAMVSIEGRIMMDKWQGQDGETNERYLINATNFDFVGGKNETQTATVEQL